VLKCFASDGEKQETKGEEGKQTEGGDRGAKSAALAAQTSKNNRGKHLDSTKIRYSVSNLMRSLAPPGAQHPPQKKIG
jgi:hypothetical protein